MQTADFKDTNKKSKADKLQAGLDDPTSPTHL